MSLENLSRVLTGPTQTVLYSRRGWPEILDLGSRGIVTIWRKNKGDDELCSKRASDWHLFWHMQKSRFLMMRLIHMHYTLISIDAWAREAQDNMEDIYRERLS